MTARAYEQYLTEGHVKTAQANFGFDDVQRIERHIMDFKIHSVISKNIPACVRGGMAVPLHTSRSSVRLSEDIDIYVFEKMDTVRAYMGSLNAELRAHGITAEEYRPKGGRQRIPLVTYLMHYMSAMGSRDKVKIDFLCDARLEDLPHREFRPPLNLGHFSLLHPIVALDAGALVADKITTLSMGTIGYPEKEKYKMNKQIYDIGQLLKHMSDDQIVQAIYQYNDLALHKGRYPQEFGQKPAYPVSDITDGVCDFLLSVLRPHDRFILEGQFTDAFGGFKGAYLGKLSYSKSSHRVDTLFTMLFAATLFEHGKNNISVSHAAEMITDTADTLKLMKDPLTRSDGKTRIKSFTSDDSSLEARIRNLPLEAQYLLRQISLVSPGLLGLRERR